MRIETLAGLLALSVAGCTSGEITAPPPAPSFLGVVATPFLVAFKLPVCAASIVLAGPAAAVATLGVQGADANLAEADVRRDLNSGLNQNCGPPYVVTP